MLIGETKEEKVVIRVVVVWWCESKYCVRCMRLSGFVSRETSKKFSKSKTRAGEFLADAGSR